MAMSPSYSLRLGSRGSPLAMTQSRLVAGMLAHAMGERAEAFPIQKFLSPAATALLIAAYRMPVARACSPRS